MTPLFCRKKRYFSTTSMLRDRYFGFPPLHKKNQQRASRWRVLAFYRIAPCLIKLSNPEVVTIRTEREVRTKVTEGQYSPVRFEQARLVSSLLYSTGFMPDIFLSNALPVS